MSRKPVQLDLDSSIVDWAIEHPQSLQIFQRHGIDYSCAGKSLEYACRHSGMDPQLVLDELRQLTAQP